MLVFELSRSGMQSSVGPVSVHLILFKEQLSFSCSIGIALFLNEIFALFFMYVYPRIKLGYEPLSIFKFGNEGVDIEHNKKAICLPRHKWE